MSKKLPPFPGKYPHNYSDFPSENIPDYFPQNLQLNSSRNLEIVENFESESSSDELSLIWQLFKRRWLVILFTTLGMTVGAHLLSAAQIPIYEGKFLLLIEKEENTPSPTPPTTPSDGLQINPTRTTVDYSTEIQILGSPTVLAPILKEIATRYPDIYRDINIQNLDKLNIRQITNTKIIEVSFRHHDTEKIEFVLNTIAKHYLKNGLNTGRSSSGSEGIKFLNQQIAFTQNRVAKIESRIEDLRRKYQFIEPQIQAKELTQQLIATEKEYLTADIQLKQAQVAYENLRKQLNMTPEEAIAVNDLTESPRYQALLQQLQQIELEIANKSAIFTDESPQILTLKEQRENILKLLEEEKAKYPVKTEQNSGNVGYSQIRAKLTQDLLKVENDIKILKSRKEGLAKLLEDIKKRINQLPSVAREYTELQRELNYATDSLKRFIEAKEKLEIQESQKGKDNQLQLISPPQVSDKPVSALPIPPWLLGLLGGLTVGMTIATIIDKLDGTVYNIPQLKTLTRIPILGAIPLDKSIGWTRKNRPIFTSDSSVKTITETEEIIIPSSLSNACQHLLANLSLLLPDYECNFIVVSSPQPEEGKSTVSLNLAKTAARMGKRVLLVDANLRQPKLHQLVGLAGVRGLENIVRGETKWEEVIMPMGKSLFLITAGEKTNPTTPQDGFFPFLSTSLARWVEEVKACGKFDLVICDTPAFLNFFETKIIASHCDGVLLVMRMRKSQYSHLTQVCEQLRLANARLLGVVANGVY